MRIGELARRAGVSRDTIRLYERKGLLQSEAATAETNSYRDYPEDCVLTLELIDLAQAAGMTLADVSILMAQLSADAGDGFDGLDFLDRKIAEVSTRIARATRFLETLQQTRAALEAAPLGGEIDLKTGG